MTQFARREFLKFGAVLTVGAVTPQVLRADSRKDRFDWRLHAPEEVGMSRAGLEGIRAAIQKNIDNKVIPGAVTAVARHNKLVWYEAQGVSTVEANTPLRKDDLYRMMSSTKPITALAVLMMMEAGRLSIDDKVNRFIPTFKDMKVAVAPPGAKDASQVRLVPAERDITIKDLLTHTSGLSGSGDLTNPITSGSLVNKIERQPNDTLADFIPRLGSAALDFQPGTLWRYSPVDGFDVLLRIVEITSRQPADRFMRERIFEPLDMRDTHFNLPPESSARVVNLYNRKDGNWQVAKPFFGNGPFKYMSGAGGLFSTVHDFMQYEAMLLNRGTLNGHRLLKPETVALMSRNHIGKLFAEWIPPVTGGHGFGLGVRIVEDQDKGSGRSVGAFGWGGAYGTESWVDPALDIAAAMFIQMDPAPTNVRTDFQQSIRKAIVS